MARIKSINSNPIGLGGTSEPMMYANDRIVDSNTLRPNSNTGETVTPTKENKAMSLDGTESSSTAFFLYTFTAEADKVYRITPFGIGGEYAQHAAVKLVKDGTTVGLYYFSDNTLDNTRYIVNFAGTVKVCVRSTVTTLFASFENTAMRESKGVWSSVLGFDVSWYDPDDVESNHFFRHDTHQIVETSASLCVYEATLEKGDFIELPPVVVYYALNSPLNFWDEEAGAYVPDEDAWNSYSADHYGHYYFTMPYSGKVLLSCEEQCISKVRVYRGGPVSGYFAESEAQANVGQMSLDPSAGQIAYELRTATQTNNNRIVNAVMHADGTIIAARSNGTVVRIGYDGTEEVVLAITGTFTDWRCLFMDSSENVYASPHASWGSMTMTDRGLYKLEKGDNSFTKVISLYDPNSIVPSEAAQNDDTIWTMCEDRAGNLYAGVYAHTVRKSAVVYKSTDGGDTWSIVYDFIASGVLDGSPGASDAKHVHSIVYSRWKDALYAIVGEVNTVLKSTDGGDTWTNLHVVSPWEKGSAMLPTRDGVIIGSDGAYNCVLFMLLDDDKTIRMLYKGWAGTVFAIRKSDVTGFIYAFTKIDSSVTSSSYYPPDSVTSADDPALATWLASVSEYRRGVWTDYYNSVKDEWPEDAIKPRHYAILVSRDGGSTWSVLFRSKKYDEPEAYGCWTSGYFRNGECLTGRFDESGGNRVVANPIVVSEGRHRYVQGGVDLSGEMLAKAGTSTTVTPFRNFG